MAETTPLPPDGFPLAAESPFAEAHQVISRLFEKYPEPLYDHQVRSVIWEADARQVVLDEPSPGFELMCAAVERLRWLRDEANASDAGYSASISGGLRNCSSLLYYLTSVLGERRLLHHAHEADALTRQVAALFAGDVSDTARQMPNYRLHSYGFPVEIMVRQWEWFYVEQPPAPDAEDALRFISKTLKSQTLDRKNRCKLAARIDTLLGDGAWPDPGEPWADAVLSEFCRGHAAAGGAKMELEEKTKCAQSGPGPVDPLAAEAARLVQDYWQQTAHNDGARLKECAAGRAILAGGPALQAAALLAAYERLAALFAANERPPDHLYYTDRTFFSDLLSRPLPLTAGDVERILPYSEVYYRGYRTEHQKSVLRHVERFAVDHDLTPAMRESLQRMQADALFYSGIEQRKLKARITALLGETDAGLPDAGEAWADAARGQGAGSAAWAALFIHAATADGAKPSGKWLAEAERNRRAVGDGEFRLRVAVWLRLTSTPAAFDRPAPVYDDYVQAGVVGGNFVAENKAYRAALQAYHSSISEKNITILKGLAWYCAPLADAELARAVGHLAEQAFGNVRERGAWAKSAGNAALWALGRMPGGVGVGPLARLRTRLRDRGALKLIASSIEAAAQTAGMTVDELEDLAVPTGGLEATGKREESFEMDGSAVLTLDAKTAKTNLQWFGADGKPRKAVPAAVKANHAAEVKALKAAEEEIKSALSAQAARFDTFLLDEREWPLAQWKERYLSHPILGNIARRLIWTLDGIPFLPDDLPDLTPPLLGAGGRSESLVKLWHPLGAAPEDVLAWRRRLEQEEIVQPFKQAHREIYLLTAAERSTRTYSNRFAAHVIKQHQFNSLCVLRGWKNTLRLMVDDFYPPATRDLPRHNLRAEFWVEGIGDDYGVDTNDAGTYLRLATDQVRFYPLDGRENYAHASGGGYAGLGVRQAPAEPLPLDQVPALAFSEVMRDIDLFVGVASVGNDPTWADGGPQGRHVDYWRDYAFGDLSETAKTRADVLARLLPRLKIAARCRLDGKFLVVQGDLRTYKIHLGSGNILMEPNDQYLCIVPNSRGEDGGDLFLPFAGDRVLAVVLSKAFLLAADTQIADLTITRQIGGQ